jgi:hypothetical protein
VWNHHFDAFLKRFGLKPSESDPCLYLRHQGSEFTMVIIWVDDGLICSSSEAIDEIISYLSEHFEMRSSEANHFVDLSISRKREEKTLYVSQPDNIKKILRCYHMDKSNPVSLHLSFVSVLSISGCAHVISIHAFHLELSCYVYLISSLHLVECLYTIQKPLTQILFVHFLHFLHTMYRKLTIQTSV